MIWGCVGGKSGRCLAFGCFLLRLCLPIAGHIGCGLVPESVEDAFVTSRPHQALSSKGGQRLELERRGSQHLPSLVAARYRPGLLGLDPLIARASASEPGDGSKEDTLSLVTARQQQGQQATALVCLSA